VSGKKGGRGHPPEKVAGRGFLLKKVFKMRGASPIHKTCERTRSTKRVWEKTHLVLGAGASHPWPRMGTVRKGDHRTRYPIKESSWVTEGVLWKRGIKRTGTCASGKSYESYWGEKNKILQENMDVANVRGTGNTTTDQRGGGCEGNRGSIPVKCKNTLKKRKSGNCSFRKQHRRHPTMLTTEIIQDSGATWKRGGG